MSGNVYEWVNDWFEAYTASPQTDPQGPDYGSYKVARGGAWYSITLGCRTTYRVFGYPYIIENHLGFRLALSEAPVN